MSLRLAVARSGARLGVLLGIAAVVAGIAGVGTWTLQTVWAAGPAGMRAGVAALTGADGAMRWRTELAPDPAAQAEGAAGVLDRIDPADATWWRSLVTRPEPIQSGVQAGTEVVLRADAELPDRADLTSGAWPVEVDETAPSAATAEARGWAVGDEIVVAGHSLRITGLWRATDPDAPAWGGDATAAGMAEGAAGPFLVTEQTLTDMDVSVSAEWTLIPSPDLAPEHATRLVGELSRIAPALRDDRAIAPYGISNDGDLITAVTGIAAGVGAVRAIAPIPLLLIAVAGIAALTRLVSLLAAARETERTLLRARGASATGVARAAAAEALAFGLPAAAVGAAIGAALAPQAPAVVAILTGTGALLAAITVAAGRAFADARAPLTRDSGRRPVRRITGVAAAVLLVAGAALSLWQFQLYGSPLVTAADGTVSIDPLAVLAPVLALVAMPLIALVAVPALATLAASAASRRRGLVPVLPLRQLSRRAPLFAAAAFVTMLAVGGLTLTSAIAGTWRSLDEHAAQVASGGDVVVELPGRDAVTGEDALAASDPYSPLAGVDTALPVVAEPARIGSDPVDVIAMPASEAAPVLPDAREALRRIAAAIPESPVGTVTGDLAIDAPRGATGEVQVLLWAQAPSGALIALPAGDFAVADGGGAIEATPPEPAPIPIGLELRLTGTTDPIDVGVAGMRVAGAAAAEPNTEVTLDAAGTTRIPLGAETPVPVALDGLLADGIGAVRGDPLRFRLASGATIEGIVSATTPLVPRSSGTGAILTDLGALGRAAFGSGERVPQFDQLWLTTADPDAVARTAAADGVAGAVVSTASAHSTARQFAPLLGALAVGAAGALLFAIVTLAGLVAYLARERESEVGVLRALGTPARVQARARLAELGAVIGGAGVLGIVVGALAAWATARELARAAVPGAPAALTASLQLDLLPWAVGVVAFAVLAAAVATAAASRVRRQAEGWHS